MPSHPVVINEWIFHDMGGGNGLPAQQRAEQFLEVFRGRPEQIVVLRNSPWIHKAWQLWTVRDVRVQVLSKLLYLGILIDPLKVVLLNPDEVNPLPAELAEQVPSDDAYLFESALAAGADTIVTTDGRLIHSVTKAHEYEIRLVHRDEYFTELGV